MVATVAKLITVQEAAEILRLHPRTVMNMAKRGDLPGSKIGKQWRFDLEAVESWLENQFRIPGRSLPASVPAVKRKRPFPNDSSCHRWLFASLYL